LNNLILFISTQFPVPPNRGGRIVTYQHLKSLSGLGKLDIVCFIDPIDKTKISTNIQKLNSEIRINTLNILTKKLYTRNYLLKFFYTYLISRIKKIPYKIYKFYDKRMIETIKNQIKRMNYDLIVFDQLPSVLYFDIVSECNCKKYLLSHNIEYEIVENLMRNANNSLMNIIYNNEYRLLKRFEISKYKLIKNVLFLSSRDVDQFDKDGLNISIYYGYLNHFSNVKRKSNYSLNNQLLFFGNLSWLPNINGIIWFIDNVWRDLHKVNNQLILNIVGNSPPKKLYSRQKYYSNIVIHGFVNNLDEIFEKNDMLILPIFEGSGVKLKTIEGIARAIPLAASNKAIEGIMSYSQAGVQINYTKRDFIKHILFILNSTSLRKDIGRKNYEYYCSLKNNNESYYKYINEL